MKKTLILQINKEYLDNSNTLSAYAIDGNNQLLAQEKIGIIARNGFLDSYKKWKQNLEGFFKKRRDIVDDSIRYSNRSKERIGPQKAAFKDLNKSQEELHKICSDSKNELLTKLNQCFADEQLQNWLTQQIGDSKDSYNVVIKTNSLAIGSLPWEHCDLFNPYYQKNNLTFGLNFSTDERFTGNLSNFQFRNQLSNNQKKTTKVLVILGNDAEIDLGFDENEFDNLKEAFRKLENRANVDVETIKPNLTELREALKEDWDVIYYGGHSKTINNEQDGEFHLADNTVVRISELEEDFERLINKGSLKFLIANACQGLGTAFRLIKLGLPYAIVMRESVPDDFAHEYLKYLLESIVIGLPLSNTVQFSRPYIREAFDRGHKIPGASMLPVLCLTPSHINQLDEPIVQIDGLHPIAAEMKSLANLAKRRLEIPDYRDDTAIALQRFYAEILKQKNVLHHKNVVSNKGAKEYIDLSKITTSCRMSGKLIWEITMSVDVHGTNLVWGQGFVNIETGNSELLLDNRPSSWTGTETIIKGKEIAQLKVPEDASLTINNGAKQSLSITKLAILIVEQQYLDFIASKERDKNLDMCNYVRNFGGWLKDFNRRIFQKEFAIISNNNYARISLDEITYQAFKDTPFGKHRRQLGITEFTIDTDDANERASWKTLESLIRDDRWEEKDKQYLRNKGVSDDSWHKIFVPDKVIVTEARRKQEKGQDLQIKTYYQEQEIQLFKTNNLVGVS